ncbi:MAG TPA: hypothetical protein VFJ02_11005 [Vicinamibacterales bacterium]|nr:hypothetical protein [Vicinamibacterales bacterium]
MSPWLRYLIAFVVLCHGFIYVRIGSALPAPVAGWRGRSWMLRDAVAGDALETIVVSLHVLAGVATIACAMAIAFAPAFPGSWRPLAVAAGAIGIVAFAIFWDGQGRLLFEEGVIGAVLSVILLAAALLLPVAFA